jgi:hypothetical protein
MNFKTGRREGFEFSYHEEMVSWASKHQALSSNSTTTKKQNKKTPNKRNEVTDMLI